MISILVATDKNRVIGRENKIPWRVRDDLVMLARRTRGHTVILGRVTYDSMVWYYNRSGKTMPGKTYIVVTRNPDYTPARENARVAHSVDEAIAIANDLGDEDIFAIGGAGIFKEILPRTGRIYLTEVQTEAEGDAYFPPIDTSLWHEVSRERHPKDERNEFGYHTIVLERF